MSSNGVDIRSAGSSAVAVKAAGDDIKPEAPPQAASASLWHVVTTDGAAVGLLLLLYFLQGVPMGLAASIPMILIERGASATDLATFSLSSWPYSLKLLWAPLVDALYTRRWRLGKRKSWIIPVQLLVGALLLVLSSRLDVIFNGDAEDASHRSLVVDVPSLTAICFGLYLLVATQDIAVDAWALTLLRPEHVSYAAVCNTFGQTLGVAAGSTLLVALDSASFANDYIRIPSGLPSAPHGLLSMASFFALCGCAFIACTICVWLLKPEADDDAVQVVSQPQYVPLSQVDGVTTPSRTRDAPLVEPSPTPSPMEAVTTAYREFGRILTLPPVRMLVFILLTWRLGTCVAENVTTLVMQKRGVTKESLTFMDAITAPLQLILQIVMSPLTAGPRPVSLLLHTYIARLALSLLWLGIIAFLLPGNELIAASTSISMPVLLLILVVSNVHGSVSSLSLAANMAFFSRVADPAIGGTYMTLLNTFHNLGFQWPRYLSLRSMDWVSVTQCVYTSATAEHDVLSAIPGTSCSSAANRVACEAARGMCVTTGEGFHVLLIASTLFGIVWMYFMRDRMLALQSLPLSHWRVAQVASANDAGADAAADVELQGADFDRGQEISISADAPHSKSNGATRRSTSREPKEAGKRR